MCNMYTYATYITYLKPQTWSNSLGECIEKGGKGEHKTAILENQMLEVRGEGKDSPKSYWEKLGRRQMNKNTGGQREGSLGTWRMEGSSLICTLSTDVTSETSIMTHYITAKDWEPYLVCVISLNSYNQKKKKRFEARKLHRGKVGIHKLELPPGRQGNEVLAEQEGEVGKAGRQEVMECKLWPEQTSPNIH